MTRRIPIGQSIVLMAQLPNILTSKHLLNLLRSEKNLNSALSLFDFSDSTPRLYPHRPQHVFRCVFHSKDNGKFLLVQIIDMLETQKCRCYEDVVLIVSKAYSKLIDRQLGEIFVCRPELTREKRKFEKAKEMLVWMWEHHFKPDVYGFGTVAGGFKINGEALELLDEMAERGVNPDITCYNILINGFLKKGDVTGAHEIWERLISGSSVYPNVVAIMF